MTKEEIDAKITEITAHIDSLEGALASASDELRDYVMAKDAIERYENAMCRIQQS